MLGLQREVGRFQLDNDDASKPLVSEQEDEVRPGVVLRVYGTGVAPNLQLFAPGLLSMVGICLSDVRNWLKVGFMSQGDRSKSSCNSASFSPFLKS